ncbi:MAG: hypothetical protein J6K16_04255 [Alphaproteobacteria bacterium]|nr:hypothetical protein [Alphaproteobacteria bacterium]
MKILPVILAALILTAGDANAQYSSSKEAQYLAVVKAVADYKIDDEEHLRKMEKLRENEKFNRELYEMIQQLDNSRRKDSKNRKVLQILENAGKQLQELLD